MTYNIEKVLNGLKSLNQKGFGEHQFENSLSVTEKEVNSKIRRDMGISALGNFVLSRFEEQMPSGWWKESLLPSSLRFSKQSCHTDLDICMTSEKLFFGTS